MCIAIKGIIKGATLNITKRSDIVASITYNLLHFDYIYTLTIYFAFGYKIFVYRKNLYKSSKVILDKGVTNK